MFDKQYLKSHTEAIHEGQKIHACNLCNKVFTQTSSMNKHIKIIHEKVEKAWKCDKCEKRFFINSELKKSYLC